MTRFLTALAFLLFAFGAAAQEAAPANEEEERSFFTAFIEDRLSTPNRQIRLRGISGALSSEATIEEITIADREGIWLRIENASIDWDRSTLVLRQRLEIERLAADRVEVLRKPLPDEGLPSPEAGGFSVPELPIAINLGMLEVPLVSFGGSVFGLESQISVTGNLALAGGSLDTELDVTRLDGPGGRLALDLAYAADTERFEIDFQLQEPENGVVANLLTLEGRPPVELVVAGAGPLDALDVQLSLATAGEPALSGTARLRGRSEGLGFTTDVSGTLARLVPEQYRPFFGDRTQLTASGVVRDSGGTLLQDLSLESGALNLTAAAETASDGFLTALSLEARISDPAGEPVLLPGGDGQTKVGRVDLLASYGEANAERWQARLLLSDLTTADFAAGTTRLELGGTARNLERPEQRSITFEAEGAIEDIIAERADIAQALGERLDLTAQGSWSAGQALRIANAAISGNGLSIASEGNFTDGSYDGTTRIEAASLAPFSGFANRELAGRVDLTARGLLKPFSGGFDLTFDGEATDLNTGVTAVDGLLSGATTLTGRVARTDEGIAADEFALRNAQVEIEANGTIASEASDFDIEASVTDLARITPRAQGRLELKATAKGAGDALALQAIAKTSEAKLVDKRLSDATLRFDGTLGEVALVGQITLDAFLDGTRTSGSAEISFAENERSIRELSLQAGGAELSGEVAQNSNGLFSGMLALDAAELETVGALLLRDVQGAAQARIELAPRGDDQWARIDAEVTNLQIDETRIGAAGIEAQIDDLLGVPLAEGEITADNLRVAGIDIATLQATASTQENQTDFRADARLANGADIALAGVLEQQEQGFTLGLDTAELTRLNTTAYLVEPTQLQMIGDDITISPTLLNVAGGEISISGTVSDRLDLDATLQSIPLSIANTVRPDLGLAGTVSGNAMITGTRDSPQAEFELIGRDIEANALVDAGVSSLDIDATGRSVSDRLNIAANLRSPGGLSANISGTAPLSPDGQLALDVELQSFPLTLLNRQISGQDLAGSVTGTARVAGAATSPDVTFSLSASGLSARPLANLGAAPLDLSANGNFSEGVVNLSALNAQGPLGLSVEASGRIPLSGSGLQVNAQASVPLQLANRQLISRGTQFSGSVQAQISATGSVTNPSLSGVVTTRDATVIDPMTNLRLSGIQLDAALAGETVTLQQVTANLSSGGSVSANGTISTNAAAGFPASIAIRLSDARYTDGDMLSATVGGALSLEGPLTRDPLLSGNIDIARAEILVPDGMGSDAAQLRVRHENAPAAVRQTLQRARAEDGTPMPSSRPSVMRLDVTVNAPARIFVRGRGLDAELGGSVRLTGPVTSVRPVGAFRLIRGRLGILGQRITFDEGTVTLVGDLDPFLDFVARSRGSDILVFINVTGRVSDLEITFSSQPDLPEDEVLARLIFKRSVGELSPLQLAQLAAAAAELAGGGNSSLLGSLRNATGLDDLDVVTDSEGNAAVRAGRYVQENIYLGVEAGAGGSTRGTINLDITEDLKARGSVGSDGDSSVGIFFEKDY
ncbi:translocation/assembly module TamB domain-containing protein [Nitratireductor basaltis]|uniref:Gramicidin S biosynthesis GRST protein n=1 Tax=Nitratireductor basaltis TaxID=472175 RepID=A0A084U9W9_9HYPH|nr:translocation/assembly module TamB domain-containing protein [Nitratireductor basaltis]KFB09755.1 Gramicidin S biosynthesis GRST protein [Nitratireductor basaltis]